MAPIIRVPVFALMALAGVLYDLLFARATLLTLGDGIPQESRALWLRASTFGFNLATIAGALALFVMVARIARRGDAVPLLGRLALAICMGVFVATLTISLTEPPSSELAPKLMLGRSGGYMLMSILAVVGLRASARHAAGAVAVGRHGLLVAGGAGAGGGPGHAPDGQREGLQ